MEKITCNVVRDLLPPYAEQMLCEDSIRLVEDHLKSCKECEQYLELLKQETFHPIVVQEQDGAGVKEAFKKIKRKIWMRRFVSVLLSVIVVAAMARVVFYFYAEKETYISLENSGLKMEGDKLYTTKEYLGRLHSFYSADQHTMFLIMNETMQARRDYPMQDVNEVLYDFANQIDPADADPHGGDEDKLQGIEKVYYMSEACADVMFDFDNPEVWEKQSKEVEEKSILLWEKSNEKM